MQNQRIVIEVGKKYGLSQLEAVELYNQYWMEFVVKKLGSLKYDYVSVLGLGAFVANQKQIKKRYELLETNPERKSRLRTLYTAAFKSRYKKEPELGLD